VKRLIENSFQAPQGSLVKFHEVFFLAGELLLPWRSLTQ
jgi:hypothetical protein